jgi:hypothetical protein
MNETNRLPKAPFRFALLLVVFVIGVLAAIIWNQFRQAHASCIHSYVASVQKAVDDFHARHHHYPGTLDEIDKTRLDYDCGLELSDLDYEISSADAIVSYKVSE